MEERKKRFEDKNEVRGKLGEVLKKLSGGATFFDGVHVFTPHSDIPDDSALRLIFLPPARFYSREEPRLAFDALLECVRDHGTTPRYRGNRLIFLAADHAILGRLRDCIRAALAWRSIVDDVAQSRLNIDLLQKKQAEKEAQTAEDVLPRVARECYKWLLCPVQATPTDPKASVEAFPLNTSGSALGSEIERVCVENELVIATWSPIHLRSKLKDLYWKADKPAFGGLAFWEDTMRYLYLPRLKSRGVLEQAIVKGAGSRDFFGTAYGLAGNAFDGFKLGDSNIQLDDTLLLIEPEAAKAYAATHVQPAQPGGQTPGRPGAGASGTVPPGGGVPPVTPPKPTGVPSAHSFIGTVRRRIGLVRLGGDDRNDRDLRLLQGSAFSSVKFDYHNEFWDAVRLGRFEDANEGLSEMMRRRNYVRPKVPSKAISTIHKAKGLECDDVLILPCDVRHFSDSLAARCKLYVAMSRAKRSLTFVVSRTAPSPLVRI